MDLNKNGGSKRKKKKQKKELKKQIKEDCELYIENKDPNFGKKKLKNEEEYFQVYDITINDTKDKNMFIVKNDSFVINNGIDEFDVSVKNLKNNKNNYFLLEEYNQVIDDNNSKKNKNTMKIDDITDLYIRISEINEYNCIKTAFKTNGESLLNNEISKKYNKKKCKENNTISDKLRDIFKKLVMKDTKSRPNLSNILLSKEFDDNTKIRLIKKYIKYSNEDDYLSDQAEKIRVDIDNIISKKQNIIMNDNEILTEKVNEKIMPSELKLKLENLNIRVQTSTSNKLQNFINDILKIPYNRKKTHINNLDDEKSKQEYIKNIYKKLNDKLYGLDVVKNSILSYFCLKLNNPEAKNKKFLCLCGPPGVGKTSIVQALSQAIDIPYSYISMANINEPSILLGHSYTFEESMYGNLSSSVIKNECKNGIIIFDELDKCSEKVQKTMLGIFDPLQNSKFVDAYFGDFYLDLSETLMIICVNSIDTINPYLRDRFHVVNIEGYNDEEKRTIINNYIIPTLEKEHKINIDIEQKVIDYILKHNDREKGIRKINTDLSKIYELVIVDKYINNYGLNNKFTMKDISKLNLELSRENELISTLYV